MNDLISKLQKLAQSLRVYLAYLKRPASPVLPTNSPVIHISRIKNWADAIQFWEGWYPTSPSWKHNNPGNLRPGEFTNIFPHAGTENDFLVFADYAQGRAALEGFLTNACEGKYAPVYKPDMTLDAFTRLYAQPPQSYIDNIAKKLKVDATKICIKELL